MANISITSQCNRRCRYCFALEALDDINIKERFMKLEMFKKVIDFLLQSGIDEVRLLGGEPTIHPEFNQCVDVALERGLNLVIFSGGLIPEKSLSRLEQIPEENVSVLVNVIFPSEEHTMPEKRQSELFRRLGPRIILGLNIDSPGVKFDFLLDFIAEFGLAQRVRLGLAHPILGGSNTYLHPRYYPEVGYRTSKFALKAQEKGVHVGFDCGWVPCMFPDSFFEILNNRQGEIGLRCNPILDVLPDGSMISCYPLANHTKLQLVENCVADKLRTQFMKSRNADRIFMLYKECSDCEWRKSGACTGGCLAASMRRLRRPDFTFSVSPDFQNTTEKEGNSEFLQMTS